MTQALLKATETTRTIPFIDLKTQQAKIRTQVDAAIKRVLDHGIYVMGPEVTELETQLAEFCGAKHAITCANGTDALTLALMAKKIRPGDAVFVPSFTFAATAEVVALQGAQPVFIDSLADTYNIDPQNIELGIKTAKSLGLRPAGIIAVDLFGQPADYAAMQAIAQQHNLWIIADAAQSFGASYKGRKVGNVVDLTTTSFFPAKPFGCYGDGGAVFTNDDDIAATIKSLRMHGQGLDKYDNARIGFNSRLDSIQAAILLEKLKIFTQEIQARQFIAEKYNELLGQLVIAPSMLPEATSVWAQYTIRLPQNVKRNILQQNLKEAGIPTMIYYAKPLHLQTAFKKFLTATRSSLKTCEALANSVISLPISGYINATDIDYVATNVLANLFNA